MPAPPAEFYPDTTEDSLSESHAIVSPSRTPTPGASRCTIRGLTALAAALALMATVILATDYSVAARSPSSQEGVISTAAKQNVSWRTGCSNWEAIRMHTVENVVSLEKCQDLCSKKTGCVQANYQTNNCQENDPVAGFQAKTCNLYSGLCEEYTNACWDLVKMPTAIPDEPTAHRTGCSNFEQIKIGDPLMFGNSYECASACAKNLECVAMNYQPGACSGNEMIQKGACYLFKGRCKKTANPCWDLYEGFRPATTTPTTTPPSETTAA